MLLKLKTKTCNMKHALAIKFFRLSTHHLQEPIGTLRMEPSLNHHCPTIELP